MSRRCEIQLVALGFHGIERSPHSWVAEAENLREAADILWDSYRRTWKIFERFLKTRSFSGKRELVLRRIGLFKVAFLTLGLATENLLKAIVLSGREGAIGMAAGKLKWPGKGHNQRALAHAAGISFAEDDLNLLDELTAFVEWAGRYPLPLKESDLDRVRAGDGNRWEKACSVFDRLLRELNDATRRQQM